MNINNEISQLARILRDNGDKILNGSSKLILSTDLLNNLNDCFNSIIEQRDSITSSFHVINYSNTNVETISDLHFLHDFVQKALGLKLTTGATAELVINITRFKCLKLLELQKINVDTIIGIGLLRSQLQFLICCRSITALKDVLEKCGADESEGSTWSELKEGIFTHNNLQTIDNSLEYVQWLHRLDLSHNQIKDAEPINCLTALKYLNLSYNKLEYIPAFTGQICNRLQVFVLKNNFIEDIRNVAVLENLCELDLSNNCIIEHSNLAPVAHLEALQCINLSGNPLSYHPQHRIRATHYLHANVMSVRFVLDNSLLNKYEQQYVGSLHPVTQQYQAKSLMSSINSITSENTIISERPKRIRNVTIADVYHEPEVVTGTSVEHLKVKNKIEHLIEAHGEKWLKYQTGNSVQEALGFEQQPVTPGMASTSSEVVTVDVHKEKEEAISEKSINNTFTTAHESVISDNSLYEQDNNSATSTDEDVDLGDGEESLYLATIKGETDSVFLVVTNTYLSERECSTSKERTRWSIESLISCEMINGNESPFIQLKFDTLRRDHKQRQYVLDNEEMTRLVEVLTKSIANKPPDVVTYQCIKCSNTFTKEKVLYIHDEKQTVDCPNCGSTLVIEDDS